MLIEPGAKAVVLATPNFGAEMFLVPLLIIGLFVLAYVLGFVLLLVVILWARRKERNLYLWVATGVGAWVGGGVAGLLVALAGLACFHRWNEIPEEEQQASKTRAKMFCGIIVVVGISWRIVSIAVWGWGPLPFFEKM